MTIVKVHDLLFDYDPIGGIYGCCFCCCYSFKLSNKCLFAVAVVVDILTLSLFIVILTFFDHKGDGHTLIN